MKRNVGKKRLAFILVAVCLVGLIGIGISYSYYLANISTCNEENKNSNITTTTITNVVMDMQGKVSSNGAYPGHKMVKEVVVRGIGESNSLPANASIQITPDLGDFSSDVTWKLYKSEEAITCSSTLHKEGNIYEESTCNIPSSASLVLEGSSDSDYLDIVVSPNTETKYYLVVEYLNKTDIDQSSQMGKSFSVDIDIGESQSNPLKKIIASVDKTGKCPTINSDGTVNVTKAEATDGYLCKAKDAYGDSYYYRGNVTNNYVKFADKYWRIVRINGDGTVRVIYDGTSAHTNGEHSTDRQIGTSAFNYYWKRNNIQDSNDSYVYLENAGVGYMYGNADTITETTSYLLIPPRVDFTATSTYYIAKEYTFYESSRKFTLKDQIAVLGSDLTRDYVGYYYTNNPPTSTPYSVGTLYKIMDTESGEYGYVQYGTSSKEVAQTNTNDSTIKTYLDNWYKTNISGTENERYLADNIFCNDRSFDSNNSGTGAGMSVSLYNSPDLNIATFNLKCLQQNDAFTVSDTGNGNGALTYPIGLISADEVVLAGGWNADNNGYYLYSGLRYWTSSPIGTIDNHALIYNVNSSGRTYIDDTETDVSYAGGVRPVLNLSPNVLNNGDGSMDNPYHP